MSKKVLLGISGSLRNARRGLGGKDLITDLKNISNKEELNNYLFQEAKIHLENFEKAGRSDNLSFDKMYTNLKKEKGCTKSLYGVKGKCVLNIVPKSTKSESLIIDPKCKVKRGKKNKKE